MFHKVGMGLFTVITAFSRYSASSAFLASPIKGLHFSLYNLSRNSKAFFWSDYNRR